jgi:hypothetical protein
VSLPAAAPLTAKGWTITTVPGDPKTALELVPPSSKESWDGAGGMGNHIAFAPVSYATYPRLERANRHTRAPSFAIRRNYRIRRKRRRSLFKEHTITMSRRHQIEELAPRFPTGPLSTESGMAGAAVPAAKEHANER